MNRISTSDLIGRENNSSKSMEIGKYLCIYLLEHLEISGRKGRGI